MPKILVILGSTSTGKTDLAIRLASLAQGELVSCDSRQVYKGLDIGTGKLPNKISNVKSQISNVKKQNGFWEIEGVKIWMYDVVDPRKQYTVYNFVKDANRVIRDIRKRGKLPIIVGGSGLYLKALLDGLTNLAIPIDQKLRKKLEKLSLIELQEELHKLSPQKWEGMNTSDRQNPRRLIRAIELAAMSLRGRSETTDVAIFTNQDSHGPPLAGLGMTSGLIGFHADIFKIGLTAPREILYQRIDERVIDRMNQGMIDEAKKLHKNGLTLKRMRQLGLEYGVLADYLEGKIKSREELIKQLQGKIHGYARRQLTWFKNPSTLRLRSGRASSGYIQWFDITDRNYPAKVENLIAKWYDTPITYASKN